MRPPARFGHSDSESDDEVVVANHHVYTSISDEEENENESDVDSDEPREPDNVGGPRDSAIFGDADDLEGAQGQTPVGPIKCATAEEMLMPNVRKKSKNPPANETEKQRAAREKRQAEKRTPFELYQDAVEADRVEGWKCSGVDAGPTDMPFTGTPGLLPEPSDTENALFYMDLMCKPDEYNILANETNAYAERKRARMQQGKIELFEFYYKSDENRQHTLQLSRKQYRKHTSRSLSWSFSNVPELKHHKRSQSSCSRKVGQARAGSYTRTIELQ